MIIACPQSHYRLWHAHKTKATTNKTKTTSDDGRRIHRFKCFFAIVVVDMPKTKQRWHILLRAVHIRKNLWKTL